MKKLLSIILLLALATTLFAGCGAETAGETKLESASTMSFQKLRHTVRLAEVEAHAEEINAAGE